MALNPRQKRFVEEYLLDLNAKQAAIRAGYSERSAEVTGSKLLSNPKVSRAIGDAIKKRAERAQLTADYVVKNLKEVAERCMQKRPVLNMKGEQVVDEEGNAKWTFDSKGANRALELLGKHLGIFTEKVDAKIDAKVVFTWEEEESDEEGHDTVQA